jgi:hypothetical protein
MTRFVTFRVAKEARHAHKDVEVTFIQDDLSRPGAEASEHDGVWKLFNLFIRQRETEQVLDYVIYRHRRDAVP